MQRIKEFWTWFSLHQNDLSAIDGPNAPIFTQLGQRIKDVDRGLEFEIGPALENKKELAISANGNTALFPLVEKVVTEAPTLKRWMIVAFRQKTPPAQLKGLAIAAHPALDGKVIPNSAPMGVAVKDMRFSIRKENGKAKVTVFIKSFDPNGPQRDMAEMMMQQAVGEYDMAKKIKEIECKSDDAPEVKDAQPFEDLGQALDELLPDVDNKRRG
jgi:hypothetical protein